MRHMQQGYVLLHDDLNGAWLACRFDYTIYEHPAQANLNPAVEIHYDEGDPWKSGGLHGVRPDELTGTTLTFRDAQGAAHRLTAHAPPSGETAAGTTVVGPVDALKMLLGEWP